MTDRESLGGRSMAAEIADQPRALRALLGRVRERSIDLPSPRGIVLTARGTSDHAAVYGRYLLEAVLGVPVSLCAPSLWTRYERRPALDGHLVIALSQSGRTPEIARVLELGAAAGATTLAITNDADSALARLADRVVPLDVGPEEAVPATKTFSAQLLALAVVAEQLAEVPWARADVERAPDAMERMVDDSGAAEAVAGTLAGARAVVQVGGGFLYAVALEGALKMIETSAVPVLGYSPADVLHGPIAVAGPDVPVVCYATPGPVSEDALRVAEAADARGASVYWVGEDVPPATSHHLGVPAALPEALMPLLHVVRAQQLALMVSRALGADADAPPGLTKVTFT